MRRWLRRWLERQLNNSTSNGPPAASTSTTVASLRKTFPSGIKLLYNGENIVADIIFVHGLTGDREETWTAKNTTAPWPQTLLPSKVPNARVLTFGYDANVVDWRGLVSKNRIGNHAMNLLTAVATYREDDDTNERPIIFVCHSLGGLVCEDALSIARQRPERHLQNILYYTRGIVFLGTPHHGSGLAQWAERLATAIGLLKQTNSQIIAVLESNSEVLARVQDSFHTMIRSRTQEGLPLIEITCFYEELPLLGVGVVVPSHSAILPGYVPIGIRSNHMDMTKFEHADDSGFTAIAGELRRWAKALGVPSNAEVTRATTSRQQQVEQQQSAKFIVPYTSNPGFVGRANILEKIKKNLCYGQHSKATSQARAAIFGLGGIGKTQIALAYAYQIQVDFPEVSIFWVHASNAERFHQAFSQIAQSCQIPGHDDPKADILKLVKAWLERKDQRPWLMVIDNADDTEMFFSSSQAAPQNPDDSNRLPSEGHLGRYLPECPHGSILITTRNKQTGIKLIRGRGVIEVEQMDHVESSQLIHNRLEDEDLKPDDVSLLAARLDNLPLALVQAAAFIQENSLTVTKYLQLLDQSDNTLVELLSQPFEEEGRDSRIPNAVTTTWIVSFEQIKQQYPHASDLLSLMSFFDRQGIPKIFLSHRIDQKDRQADYQQEEEDSLELEKALGILKAFSFMSEGRDNENLNMHRLIRLVMRKWLIKNGKFGEWAGKALSTVSEFYPYGSYENQKICEDYLPHAYAVLSYQGPSSTTDTIAKASLLLCTAGLMVCRGHWNEAEELQLQAVEIRKRVLGQEHPSTLTTMGELASTYQKQGRWKEAEELHFEVMETSKRVLGQEHPNTLTIMGNLASTYRRQGRWKEAEELHFEVMETSKRVLGQEHPDTLVTMGKLAWTYLIQGRWKEAEELQLQVMETRKKVLGQEHPSTLTIMGKLAWTYRKRGRWKEAEELQLQVMETRKRVLGQDHPYILTTMGNLASTYREQGRWKEAEELHFEVMEASKRVLGQEHPDTLATMGRLAWTYQKQGRWKEAEKLQLQVMETRKKVLGQEHPSTLTIMGKLAWTYQKRGRWKEAEELQLQVMETRKRVLGQDHPYTLTTMGNLASTYQGQGRWKEAEELNFEVVETRKRDLIV